MREKLRKVPLFGGLIDSKIRDHGAALKENIAGLVVSLSPLWIGGFILCLTNRDVGGYLSAVCSNTSSGELFLYSTSILAPILYMALHDPPRSRRFPSKLSHVVLVIVVLLLSATAFGLQRAGVVIVQDFATKVSYWSLFMSIILLYLATVYRNARLPVVPEVFQEEENNFAEDYRKHRS